MWKLCQLLKGGRSHVARSRNGNNWVSQQSHQDGNGDPSKPRVFKRPLAFTPSEFRSSLKKKEQNENAASAARILSTKRIDPIRSDESDEDGSDGGERGENYKRYRRPGRDYDNYWRCRCRCRLGDWISYTTMVAATIHLSRVTVHLLPNNKEKSDIRRVDGPNGNGERFSTSIADFKNIIRSNFYQFLYRAGPVFFPDVFKVWYVLPQAGRMLSIASCLEGSSNAESIEEEQNIVENEPLLYDFSSNASSPSTSTSSTSTKTTTADCAVQTDADATGTLFDELMLQSARRISSLGGLTDVGLEYAIGVDLLKRELYNEAVDYLVGAAQAGHAGAMYNLGICYSRGYGLPRDLSKAVEFWRTAADKGHGLSKYQMGACHARGIGGLAMDHERALRYMQAAAEVNVPEAKTYMAAYEYKQGRLDNALDLLREAVSAGYEKASELLYALSGDTSSSDHHHPSGTSKPKPTVYTSVKPSRVQRRRFWASSSSEREDSLSPSSSPKAPSMKTEHSSNSVVFGDDSSMDESTSQTKLTETKSPNVIETVAALLRGGSLRRSKTAPVLSYHEHTDMMGVRELAKSGVVT